MTRDNKLALIIGFGLILLVGILVSDHFSTTRRPDAANVAGALVDPLTSAGFDDPALIEMPAAREPRRGGDLLLSPGSPDVTADGVQRIVMGASHRSITPASPPTIGVGTDPSNDVPAPAGIVYHTVRPGETLTSIARRHFGDTSRVDQIARENDLADPDAIRPGDRLRIRAGGAASPAAAYATTTPAAPAVTPAASTYVVRPGDSLSEIASELLGSARLWREIYQMNRDVIDDPDNVPTGTRLKIARPR